MVPVVKMKYVFQIVLSFLKLPISRINNLLGIYSHAIQHRVTRFQTM